MMTFEALSRSFSSEPVLAGLFLLLIMLTVASAVIGAYIGARTGYDVLQKKREERLREAAIADAWKRNSR